MNAPDPDLVDRFIGELQQLDELGGSERTRLGGELDVERAPVGIPIVGLDRKNGGASVIDTLAALADATEGKLVGSEDLVDPLPEHVRRGGEGHLPCAVGHGRLQRRCTTVDTAARDGADPVGEHGREALRQCVELEDRGGRVRLRVQVDVDVLGIGFVAVGERQAEVHLRAGREPLRVRDGQLGSADGPLPGPGGVAVRDESHLALFGVADPHPPDGAPTVGRMPTGTGLAVPLRSCPVPWLPPAGGTAEATMCSIP